MTKPSEILRRGQYHYCRHILRQEMKDGQVEFCALGALGEEAGIDWGRYDDRSRGWTRWWRIGLHREIRERWGLTRDEASHLVAIHDRVDGGLAAAIKYLESIGK